MFSDPENLSRVILDEVGRGAAVDAVVLGGPGDPLRHLGIGPLLRRIRTAAHLATIVLSDGLLLGDRTVRREAGEAGSVAAVLPAVETSGPAGADLSRRDAYARHVKGIAALARETQVEVCVEIPVRPGENDGGASLEAWRRGVATIGPDRVFVLPADTASPAAEADVVENLERIGREIAPGAGVCLVDPNPVDRRCYCAERAGD
jgi:hypothetical protein